MRKREPNRRLSLAERARLGQLKVRDLWSHWGLDATRRMALIYWPASVDASSVSVEGYYDTFAAAAAARDAVSAAAKPVLVYNYAHADFPKTQQLGSSVASEWYDAASAGVWWR